MPGDRPEGIQSQAQRRFLWARHPDVARKLEDETPADKPIPERVHWVHRKWRRKT